MEETIRQELKRLAESGAKTAHLEGKLAVSLLVNKALRMVDLLERAERMIPADAHFGGDLKLAIQEALKPTPS